MHRQRSISLYYSLVCCWEFPRYFTEMDYQKKKLTVMDRSVKQRQNLTILEVKLVVVSFKNTVGGNEN